MVNPVKRIPLENGAAGRAMDEVREVVNDVAAIDILQGRLIEGLELQGGVTRKVAHKLGRKPRGWIVVKQKGWTSTGFLNEVDHGSKDRELQLLAYGMDPTISLWVF